ncbi:hypothetical protein [Pseudanabaena sp. FACHB-2040]|uniref:hypothetical protein n=1 Tax=Pseudanabaena sp. FACHB-2040 TaxID=2692859 RepID=UPI0016877C30|nr:hypothetical protein [Pseudanabaena sp. FACHB-2040]MBD2260103.1 hypothetical protein [Pseudanabaena sp. FACHB-2040]
MLLNFVGSGCKLICWWLIFKELTFLKYVLDMQTLSLINIAKAITMNSKQLAALTCGVALVSAGAIASAQLLKSEAPVAELNANHEERVQQATATALAQQIAQLEVEKVLQGEIFTQEAPMMVHLQEQQLSLEKRLSQLQPDSSQNAVVVATASAIESEIAGLEVQYAQDQAKFLDSHPTLQMRKAQIEALRQRLATL